MIGKVSKLSILDSKKKLTREIIDSFTFVKLNEKEAENNKDLKECKNIIVTLGSRGASYDGNLYASPAPKETTDVSGAGDTFTAAFILKLKMSVLQSFSPIRWQLLLYRKEGLLPLKIILSIVNINKNVSIVLDKMLIP
jgi:hypothetical protein